MTFDALGDAWRDEVIDQLRRRYMGPVPAPSTDPFSLAIKRPLERTPSEFESEISRYLSAIRARWSTYMAVRCVEEEVAPMDLRLVNTTDHVFEAVEVELTVGVPRSWVHPDRGDVRAFFGFPDAPAEWGRELDALKLSKSEERARPSVDKQVSDQNELTTVRYPSVLSRPGSEVRLPRLWLALHPNFGGQTVLCNWRATSTSTSGDDRGQIALPVGDAGPLSD